MALGQRYVQYFNRAYRRSGTLWEGRYRSCLTQAEDYLLACQRYIELNPSHEGQGFFLMAALFLRHPSFCPADEPSGNPDRGSQTLCRTD